MFRTLSLASILAVGLALPAVAQTSTTPAPVAPSVVTPATPAMTLTPEQAKTWIDKAVYSSDGSKIGNVAAFVQGTNNSVMEMHADIGGFLGLGETRIRLMPAQFKLQGDRVVLNLTAAQAKELPPIVK